MLDHFYVFRSYTIHRWLDHLTKGFNIMDTSCSPPYQAVASARCEPNNINLIILAFVIAGHVIGGLVSVLLGYWALGLIIFLTGSLILFASYFYFKLKCQSELVSQQEQIGIQLNLISASLEELKQSSNQWIEPTQSEHIAYSEKSEDLYEQDQRKRLQQIELELKHQKVHHFNCRID